MPTSDVSPTIEQQRQIVRDFKRGARLRYLAWSMTPKGRVIDIGPIEKTIRDYMNGQFKLSEQKARK